jgi:hypothetical protein
VNDEAQPDAGEKMVHDFLATHDALCPGCGYNMRGLAKGDCPECGRHMSAADVEWILQAPVDELFCAGTFVFAAFVCVVWGFAVLGVTGEPDILALWVPMAGAVPVVVCFAAWQVSRRARPWRRTKIARTFGMAMRMLCVVMLGLLAILMLLG